MFLLMKYLLPLVQENYWHFLYSMRLPGYDKVSYFAQFFLNGLASVASISGDQHYKGVISGVLLQRKINSFHHQVAGDGHVQNNGSRCGQVYLKLVRHAKNCCIVRAGCDTLAANAPCSFEVYCLLHMQG